MPETVVRRTCNVALFVGLAVALAGCLADDVGGPGGAGTNFPTVGLTSRELGFSVIANAFTFEQTYASPTQGDSLDIGLAVTGYGGGSARIEIADADGVARFALTVTQNVAQGQIAPGGRPPYTVHLRFAGFTGVFALGVAARGP